MTEKIFKENKVKNAFRFLVVALLFVALSTVTFGQIGYSITDNNADTLDTIVQQYYSFDLSTGQGTLISPLVVNGQKIQREYEGLASIGSVLFGISEHFVFNCNAEDNGIFGDPIVGLTSDLRTFRTGGIYPAANGVANAIGPQIGETCFVTGFTETAMGYNPIDGFLYAIASDDLLTQTQPRSRLYRVSPTTGLATQVTSAGAPNGITLTTGSLGDANPYLDGMTILPDGRAFVTEARFNNQNPQNPDPLAADNGGLYRLFLTGPNASRATFVKHILPTDVNRDTGLAHTANGTLYLLLEDSRVYTTTTDPTSPVAPAVFPLGNPAGSNVLSTPSCIRPTILGGSFCGDFEGFDIPTPAVR
jgi:hypothetical protein